MGMGRMSGTLTGPIVKLDHAPVQSHIIKIQTVSGGRKNDQFCNILFEGRIGVVKSICFYVGVNSMIRDSKNYYAFIFSALIVLLFIILGGVVIHFYLISLESDRYIGLYIEAIKVWGVITLLIGMLTFFRVRTVLATEESMKNLRLKRTVLNKIRFIWRRL
jgi:hypothetical protein